MYSVILKNLFNKKYIFREFIHLTGFPLNWLLIFFALFLCKINIFSNFI